jgi:hypothetical protein
LKGSDVINRRFGGFSNIPLDIYIIGACGQTRKLQSVGNGIAFHIMAFLGVGISVDPVNGTDGSAVDPAILGLVKVPRLSTESFSAEEAENEEGKE